MSNDEPDAGEAIYYTMVPFIDRLPSNEDRAQLVLNLAKYVLLRWAYEASAKKTPKGLVTVFTALCSVFAANVLKLPEQVTEQLTEDLDVCEECKAAAGEPHQHSAESTHGDESLN